MKHIEINFSAKELEEKIEEVRKICARKRACRFNFDLRKLNLIDAVKVFVLLSSEIFCNNPNSTINCKVKDLETLKILKSRKLNNTFLGDTSSEDKKLRYRNGIKLHGAG